MDGAIFWLDLLPPEVYESISTFVTGPVDKTNLTLASSVASKFDESQRKEFVIASNFGNISKYLSAQDLFNSKLVCKMWEKGVNKLLEQPPKLRPFDPLSKSPRAFAPAPKPWGLDGVKQDYYFTTTSKIDRFLAQHEGHRISGKNPFPMRSVSIIFTNASRDTTGTLDPYWNSVRQLMTTFGREIWYLEYWAVAEGKLPSRELYDKIRDLLHFTPNLKSLEMKGQTFNKREPDSARYNLDDELIYVRDHPLPPLMHVDFLLANITAWIRNETDDDWAPSPIYACDPIASAMVQAYGNRTKMLGLSFGSKVKTFQWPEDLPLKLPNLTELHVPLRSEFDLLAQPERFQTVAKLNLSKDFPLQDLFPTLEKFPSLNVLCLKNCQRVTGNFPGERRMPNIKGLKLWFTENSAYGFLRNFENLEYLAIQLSTHRSTARPDQLATGDMDTAIREVVAGKDVRSSPLWKLFPNLKEVVRASGGEMRGDKRSSHKVYVKRAA